MNRRSRKDWRGVVRVVAAGVVAVRHGPHVAILRNKKQKTKKKKKKG